jgi:hypothetical protein
MENLKKLLVAVSACCVLLAAGCDAQPKEKRAPDVMRTEWCIQVCMSDVFENFHEKGESWGTSSSSMNGLSEMDIFTKVKLHCSSIYEGNICIEADYDTSGWDSRINYHRGSYAGVGS